MLAHLKKNLLPSDEKYVEERDQLCVEEYWGGKGAADNGLIQIYCIRGSFTGNAIIIEIK